MRKLNYHMATSLDGFVARADGSFDGFLMEGPHVADYLVTVSHHDTVLMGRGTYEVGLRYGVTNPYPNMKSYVFSRTLGTSPDPNVTLVASDAVEFVRGLKQQEGKDIWLAGAAGLAATLFAAELVDALSIKVNPFLMGQGISLVAHLERLHALELQSSKSYPNGVVTLSYRVIPRSDGGP
jgi:dihydrofolate reductase